MQGPDTGIVLVPLDDDVACGTVEQTGLHQLNVTTLCVFWIGDGPVPFADTLGKDVVIVAVKMLENC